MNINLKELAEQAGWYHAVTSGDYIFSEVQAEKFSKLIVQECIKSVKKDMYSGHTHSDFSTGYDAALENAISDIKEKFGINE